MTSPYSEDVKARVVGLVENGKKFREAAQLLTIGIVTIYLWLRRKREEGTIAPRKNWRQGHSNKIADLEKF